jgi:branched-chain amino acid transport system permease protein
MPSTSSAPKAGRHRRALPVVGLAALALVAITPFGMSDSKLNFATGVALWAAMASAWSLVASAGYVSLATPGWYGLGAYTTAVLMNRFSLPFGIALIGAAVLCTVVATVVAVPLLRLRTHYFIMGSFIIAQVIFLLVNSATFLGLDGANPIQLPLPVSDPSSIAPFFYAVAIVFYAIVMLLLWLSRRGRLGYALRAIAQDETSAELLGVPTTRYKIAAFSVSGGVTGVAGGIAAVWSGYLVPTTFFSVAVTLKALIMPIVGGINVLFGPTFGAFVFQFLDHTIGVEFDKYTQLVFGAVVMLVALALPRGVLPSLTSLAEHVRTRFAWRRVSPWRKEAV